MWSEENRKGQELYRAFLDVLTPEAIRDVTQIILGRALAGDMQAAQMVLDYGFSSLQIEGEPETDWS